MGGMQNALSERAYTTAAIGPRYRWIKSGETAVTKSIDQARCEMGEGEMDGTRQPEGILVCRLCKRQKWLERVGVAGN